MRYLRDNLFNIVTPISVSSAGDFGDGASAGASVSSDGRFVVFLSTSTNLDDNVIINNGKTNVFLRDTLLATTTTVDVGANSVLADQPSFGASVSDNNRSSLDEPLSTSSRLIDKPSIAGSSDNEVWRTNIT